MLGVGAAAAAQEGVAACTAVSGAEGLSAEPQHRCSSARVNGLPQAVRARPIAPRRSGPNTARATGLKGLEPLHVPFHPDDDTKSPILGAFQKSFWAVLNPVFKTP